MLAQLRHCKNCDHQYMHSKLSMSIAERMCPKCNSTDTYLVKITERYVTTVGGKRLCALTLKEVS